MKPLFIFKRCQHHKTPECPNVKNEGMQLAILHEPYFEFLSNDTAANIQRICEECTEFEATWRAISKYS